MKIYLEDEWNAGHYIALVMWIAMWLAFAAAFVWLMNGCGA